MTGATGGPLAGPAPGSGRTATTDPLGGQRIGPIPIEQPAGGGDDGGYGPITPINAVNRGAGGILRGAGGLLSQLGGGIQRIPLVGNIPGNILQGGGNIVGATGRGLSESNNPITGVVRGAGRGVATTGRGAMGAAAGGMGAVAGTLTTGNLTGTVPGAVLGGPQAFGGVAVRGGAGGFNAGTRGVDPGSIFRNQYRQSNAPLPGPLSRIPGMRSGGASVLATGGQRWLRRQGQQNQSGGGSPGPRPGNPNPVKPVNPNPVPPLPGPGPGIPFNGGGGFTPTPVTPFTPQFNPIFPGNPMSRYRPGYNPSNGTYRRQGGYANV